MEILYYIVNISVNRCQNKRTCRCAAFSVRLPCTGNLTGVAAFSIGLEIATRHRQLAGTPLKLRLRKECVRVGAN